MKLLDMLLLIAVYCLLTACTSTVYVTTYDQAMRPEKHFRIDIIAGFPAYTVAPLTGGVD